MAEKNPLLRLRHLNQDRGQKFLISTRKSHRRERRWALAESKSGRQDAY